VIYFADEIRPMITKEEIRDWFSTLQIDICTSLENADGTGRFIKDEWARPGGGGGLTCVLKNGTVVEKGGVNFSAVWGETPKQILSSLEMDDSPASNFYATGVSIVVHPWSPMVPIIHMNVRYFEMSHGVWWFGGGIDLTPHFVDKSDASYFHQELKTVCDRHDSTYYAELMNWADVCFFIKIRN
jgi:coproporphyrinogen III oxidase